MSHFEADEADEATVPYAMKKTNMLRPTERTRIHFNNRIHNCRCLLSKQYVSDQ